MGNVNIDKRLIDIANTYRKPLNHKDVYPVNYVEIKEDDKAFQRLRAIPIAKVTDGIVLKSGQKVILDFGDHCVGCLRFDVNDKAGEIMDSPALLKFTFGEFPLEIVSLPENYKGWLGSGWFQTETKPIVFTPWSGMLERRYSFRYLMIERTDNSPKTTIILNDLHVDTVTSAKECNAPFVEIKDSLLERIYHMSLKTLKDCEQDVFEDGPKRDRRLWIGDLKLQALTDYYTFKNTDLIKRCIYLFAGCRTSEGVVASCLYPDNSTYINDWAFLDYSLFFISCLYDYVVNTGDDSLLADLYDVAYDQMDIIGKMMNERGVIVGRESVEDDAFIDWCPDLDKEVAFLGVYIYTLRQLRYLTEIVGKNCAALDEKIKKLEEVLLGYYSNENGVFVTSAGQISWHSQVWAVLSGALAQEECKELLLKTEKINPDKIMHTPYMIHYYIEALVGSGLEDKAMDFIKHYWGKMVDAGFDCCPEVFNPDDDFDSPYNAPELNSACHAWSCTPAYWIIRKYSKDLGV